MSRGPARNWPGGRSRRREKGEEAGRLALGVLGGCPAVGLSGEVGVGVWRPGEIQGAAPRWGS